MPNRWDTTFARISKKVLQVWPILTGAGLTSAVTETVAMPILEHGFGNVITKLHVRSSLDGRL